MTGKSALYALAIAVLMGSMAVAALADDHDMNGYGPAHSSVSTQPEMGVMQPEAGEIRGPVETGALPEGSGKDTTGSWLNMDVSQQNLSPQLWGRPNIQAGD